MKTYIRIIPHAAKGLAFLVYVSFMLFILVTTLQAQSEPIARINTHEKSSLDETRISVYPNPTVDKLTLEISEFSGELFSVTLSNITGALLDSRRFAANGDKTLVEWNMAQYPSGIYIISVRSQSIVKFYRIKKE
jgi:hypothetical protein